MARQRDDDTEWVLPPVAAERLHLAPTSVGSMIRRGHLQARKDERGRWLVRLPILSAIADEAPARGTLSAEEAVAATGVPARVLWTAVYDRRLRVLRGGNELRFDPADVEAWLETHRVTPGRKESRSRSVAADTGDGLLTIEQAAARLGVRPPTFWRWLNDAELPYVVAPGVRQRAVRYVRPKDVRRLATQRNIKLRRDR
ncbi:MAG: helix-turn-helix domain-containing protein [Actinomycetota bacterium]|nr:helix-turn-helix domain-containing protein [Actinomycetota bacterium]